jgi:MerR family transcriptional regulator, light-induced transcriptional regulator
MGENELKYSIQQVSDMTGVSKQLIRKWEDRYQLVNPQRLDNGYRMYTLYEINLIKAVTKLIDEGNSVKQAVNVVQNPQFDVHTFLKQAAPQKNIAADFLVNLEVAGSMADDKKILHLLQQAHHTLGVNNLIHQIVVPYLRKIGELWCDQSWGEYQEAIASQTVRDFLANLRREMFVPEGAPIIVGSCLPGEYHEIPMHILLVQCTLKGYKTIMLGQSPAPKAIESIVKLKQPRYVLLTASTLEPFNKGYETLIELDQFANTIPNTRFLVGGAGGMSSAQKVQLQKIEFLNNIDFILEP